jgi:Fe-S cluster biosynthesis and repair protein YggX
MLEATENAVEPEDDREPGDGEIRCHRTKRVGAIMSFNPFGDEVGDFIEQNITKESWDEWMELSIKVINELRLDLGDEKGQRAYDEHMRDFLNLPGHFFENKTYE